MASIRKVMGLLLFVPGLGVALLGLGMVFGFFIGVHSSIRFAGGITIALSMLMISGGRVLMRGEKLIEPGTIVVDKNDTSPGVAVVTILLFAPLTLGMLALHVTMLKDLFGSLLNGRTESVGVIVLSLVGGNFLWLLPGLPTVLCVRSLVLRFGGSRG